jgi:Domain of unknown function (DUF4926)
MKYGLLDTVVLARDVPAHDLHAGDLGAIVEVYQPESFEVEFVTASGQIGALVTLQSEDIRPISDTDLIAVRSLKKSA